MKLKFTWGTGIFLTIIIFVGFFVSFIIFSLTKDVNLVTKDYFPDEIAYDKKIDKIKNFNALGQNIEVEIYGNIAKIKFPEYFEDFKDVEGTVLFYFVKSYRKDRLFEIKLNSDRIASFDISGFEKGRYKLMIDWKYKNKKYFKEINTEIK